MRAFALLLLSLGVVTVSGCNSGTKTEKTDESPQPAASTETASIADLIGQLSAAEEADRCDAIDALGAMGPAAAEALENLSGLLEDKSALVRAHAAMALGQLGDAAKPAADALAKRMTDEDEDVRRMVVVALSKIKPGKEKVVPLLTAALADKDPHVKLRAVRVLAERGPAIVEPMIVALGDKKTAYWATLVLHELGPDAKPAVPALLKVLDDGDPETQLRVVETLGLIGDEAAVPKLIEVLKDHPFDIEVVAAHALGNIGPGAKDATEALEAGLTSEDKILQTVCAHSLAMIYPDDAARKQKAIDLLVAALKHEEQHVRVIAARELIKLKPDPEMIREPFLAAFETASDETRRAMFAAVATLGEEVIPRFQRALKEPAVRPYAAEALGEMGAAAAVAVPDLIAALEGESAIVREAILRAIASIGKGVGAAVPAAKAALADEDEDVRRAAIFVLGRAGAEAKDAAADLFALLSAEEKLAEDEELALYISWALAQIDPANAEYAKSAVAHLITGLASERVAIQVEAAEALGKLGAAAKDAVAALEAAAADASPDVKAALADAVKQIKGE